MAIKLPPSEFDLPIVGAVETRPNSFGTARWYLKAAAESRWASPQIFVRSFLIERCEPKQMKADAFQTIVENLNNDQLDHIASVLLQASIARSDFEADENEGGEAGGSQAFQSIIEATAHKFEESNAKFAAAMKPQIASIEAMQSAALADAERFRQLLRPLGSAGVMFEQLDSLKRSFDLITNSPFQRMIEKIQASNNSILNQYRDISGTLKGLTSASLAGSLLLTGQLTDTTRLLDQIRDQYRVADLSGTAIANQFGMLSEKYVLNQLASTGFVASAASGLEGIASKALVATVLTRYATETPSKNEVLDDAIAGLHELDVDASPDRVLRVLAEMRDQISASLRAATDKSTISLLLEFGTFILAVMMFIMTYTSEHPEASSSIEPIRVEIEVVQNEARARAEDWSGDIRYLTGHRNLRDGPSLEANVIITLNTDQVVVVNELSGDWARVTVLSYAGEDAFEGWLHRDGLIAR